MCILREQEFILAHSPEVIVNRDGEGMVPQQTPMHGGENMQQNVHILVKQRSTHSGSKEPVSSYMKDFTCKDFIICRVSWNYSPMAMKGWLYRTERVSFVTGQQNNISFSCPLVFLSTSLLASPFFASTELFWNGGCHLFPVPVPRSHLAISHLVPGCPNATYLHPVIFSGQV